VLVIASQRFQDLSRLFSSCGYSHHEITVLFLIGFATSIISGPFFGSIADYYGRRNLCQAFAAIFTISCSLKHYSSMPYLVIGRFLIGISNSILCCSCEGWLIKQHHTLDFHSDLLASTLSKAAILNSLAGIMARLVANYSDNVLGPIGYQSACFSNNSRGHCNFRGIR